MADNPYARSAKFLKSAVHPKDYPPEEYPELAVAGRSNVGKSSLINRLVNRRRLAKVSNTPGRTQLLNFFLINDRFVLCDLPGYGYAKVPNKVRARWGPMIETYVSTRDCLGTMMLLVDVRRTPGEWEAGVVAWASRYGLALLPVVTKVDKLPPSKRKPAIAKVARKLGFSPKHVVAWSAVTGEGLSELWKRIDRFTGTADPRD